MIRTTLANHPNTATAGGAGAVGILTVWGLNAAGVETSPEVSAAIPVVITTTALFVGRRGIRGVARLLWRGDPNL